MIDRSETMKETTLLSRRTQIGYTRHLQAAKCKLSDASRPVSDSTYPNAVEYPFSTSNLGLGPASTTPDDAAASPSNAVGHRRAARENKGSASRVTGGRSDPDLACAIRFQSFGQTMA